MSFHQIWTGEGNNSGTDNSELTPPLIPRNMFDDYRAQVINNIEQYLEFHSKLFPFNQFVHEGTNVPRSLKYLKNKDFFRVLDFK